MKDATLIIPDNSQPNEFKEEKEFLLDEEQEVIESYGSHSITLISHALPIVIDSLITVTTSFGNAMIIRRIGLEAIGANAYIESLKNLFIYPVRAIFFSLQPIFGKNFEEGHHKKIGRSFRRSILLGSELSCLIAIPLLAVDPILRGMEQDSTLSVLTARYFRYYVWSIPATMTTEITNEFFIATKNHYLLIPTSILRTSLELGLGLMFVYQFDMGIDGLGLSALLQPLISTLVILLYLRFSQKFQVFELFNIRNNREAESILHSIQHGLRKQLKLLRIGFPISIQVVSGFGSSFIEIIMLGRLSKNGLISYNLSSQWSNWIINLHSSLSTSTSVLISQKLGAHSYINARRIGMTAICIGTFISLISQIPFTLLYKPMTSLLLSSSDDDQAIQDYSKILMPLAAVSTLGFGIKYIATGGLRGYRETKKSMKGELIGTIIGLVVSSILAFLLKIGPVGVGIGDSVGMLLAAGFIFIYFNKLSKRSLLSHERLLITQQSNSVPPRDDNQDQDYHGLIPAINNKVTFFRHQPLKVSETVKNVQKPSELIFSGNRESFFAVQLSQSVNSKELSNLSVSDIPQP